jgi:membrane associated rhomboid family serine protease
MGIECRLVAGRGGTSLCVPTGEAARATEQLEAYERENAPQSKAPWPSNAPRQGFPAALGYALMLLFFSGAERRDLWSVDWSAIGAAQAGLIREGAWWRAITALTLHADTAHLVGNLAVGLVFGTLVAQVLGSGLAWLAIVLAGAIGNEVNAFLQGADHTAVGASTALFGAVGILSGYLWQQRRLPWRGGIRRWAPVGGGVLLLVDLGFGGERTDIGAHVLGFAAGGLLGLALGYGAGGILQGPGVQGVYGLLACGLVMLAWLLALGSG